MSALKGINVRNETTVTIPTAMLRWNENYHPPILEQLSRQQTFTAGGSVKDVLEVWVAIPSYKNLRPSPDVLQSNLDRALEDLKLLREFAIKNATQWKMGSNHHHPIWARIAETLHEDNRDNALTYAEWKFIQPGNREDLQNLKEMAAKPDDP